MLKWGAGLGTAYLLGPLLEAFYTAFSATSIALDHALRNNLRQGKWDIALNHATLPFIGFGVPSGTNTLGNSAPYGSFEMLVYNKLWVKFKEAGYLTTCL